MIDTIDLFSNCALCAYVMAAENDRHMDVNYVKMLANRMYEEELSNHHRTNGDIMSESPEEMNAELWMNCTLIAKMIARNQNKSSDESYIKSLANELYEEAMEQDKNNVDSAV